MGSRGEMHICMKANFMGLKYDLSWQDSDECSRVVVINAITNLALRRNIMFDEEYYYKWYNFGTRTSLWLLQTKTCWIYGQHTSTMGSKL